MSTVAGWRNSTRTPTGSFPLREEERPTFPRSQSALLGADDHRLELRMFLGESRSRAVPRVQIAGVQGL
jgi:hypothetical protein